MASEKRTERSTPTIRRTWDDGALRTCEGLANQFQAALHEPDPVADGPQPVDLPLLFNQRGQIGDLPLDGLIAFDAGEALIPGHQHQHCPLSPPEPKRTNR